MKVYVLFKEEWDYSCLEDKDYRKDVFGVFTNKDDAEKAVMGLNEKEKYVVKESSEFAIKGLNYYIQECETDKIYNIED